MGVRHGGPLEEGRLDEGVRPWVRRPTEPEPRRTLAGKPELATLPFMSNVTVMQYALFDLSDWRCPL